MNYDIVFWYWCFKHGFWGVQVISLHFHKYNMQNENLQNKKNDNISPSPCCQLYSCYYQKLKYSNTGTYNVYANQLLHFVDTFDTNCTILYNIKETYRQTELPLHAKNHKADNNVFKLLLPCNIYEMQH